MPFRSSRLLLWLAGLLALVVAACASPPAPAQKPAPTPAGQVTRGQESAAIVPTPAPAKPTATVAPRRAVKLKWGSPAAITFNEVPMLAAYDELKGQGIDVEVVAFPDADLATKALVGGQIDVGITNPPGFLAANRAGADVRVFFNAKLNEWVLMAPSSIKDPKQLDGKRIAHHGTGITKALALYVGDRYGIKPTYLTIAGSGVRAQALIQGQIDASPLNTADMVGLESLKPGAFHPLIRYEEELPGVLQGNHFTTKRERLESDPETWQVITTALVKNHRRATLEPEWLADQAMRFLPKADRANMLASARAYAQIKVFTVDGGIKKEKAEKMLEFYAERGLVKKEDLLPFDQWATTRFVDAANAQLGR